MAPSSGAAGMRFNAATNTLKNPHMANMVLSGWKRV
jgi:hypothetical protein